MEQLVVFLLPTWQTWTDVSVSIFAPLRLAQAAEGIRGANQLIKSPSFSNFLSHFPFKFAYFFKIPANDHSNSMA